MRHPETHTLEIPRDAGDHPRTGLYPGPQIIRSGRCYPAFQAACGLEGRNRCVCSLGIMPVAQVEQAPLRALVYISYVGLTDFISALSAVLAQVGTMNKLKDGELC